VKAGDDLYLESWLHSVIRAMQEKDVSFRSTLLPGTFTGLSRSDVEKYQLFNLQRTVHYAAENSSYYREQFEKFGIKPEDIRELNDLKMLPFTEPHQLAEAPYRFLCLSRAQIARIYTFITSGTTGPQKKIFWTFGDLEKIIRFMAAGIGVVANSADVVQICLPNGRPYSQADLLYRGVERIGATPVLAGMDLSARGHLDLIEQSHSTVLFGYAGHIFRLTKELQAFCDLSKKGVKALFLAAEYLPDIRRQELQNIWNCRIYTHYGLTEMGLGVAVECEAGDGYHFNEADLLLEIVDPHTGHPVPPGVEGELVFTTLNREAMPLIRYRTHDISSLMPESCPCGATGLLRFSAVKKRLETIIVLNNGDEIYPTVFDETLYSISGLVDYQVIVTKQNDLDHLKFKIELRKESNDSILEIQEKLLAAPVIAKSLSSGNMVAPHIEILSPGALRTANRAKKLIQDQR
jgi:phenylacetate-CoA ligase